MIDWILDNLIDKSRTRRGVIKKLKDLGLIFKAPTKKTNAAAASKFAWNSEKDERLNQLYEEHRLSDKPLKRICEAMEGKTRNAIIKRLIELGCIADKSEIVPVRGSKKSAPQHFGGGDRSSSSEYNSESEDEDESRGRGNNRNDQPKRKLVKSKLNVGGVKSLLAEIDESFKEAIDWVIESFKEAKEDLDEPTDNPDDGVPLVPFISAQHDAMENQQFQKLLKSIGVEEPADGETYWRIPANLTVNDLELRTKLLSGEDVEEEVQEETQDNGQNSDDEPEFDFAAARAKRSKDLNSIMYNNSDDEEERRAPEKPKPKKKKQANLFDMIMETNTDEQEVNDPEIDSENFSTRLAELNDSSDSDNEINTSKSKVKKRTLIDSSDSENDDTNNKSNAAAISGNTFKNNDVDDGSVVNTMVSFNSSEIVEDTTNNKSKKRERSLDSDSSSDGEMNVRAKKIKNVRRLVSEDEEED